MNDFELIALSNKKLYDGVFELKAYSRVQLPKIRAGQFAHIQSGPADAILRRPFCICKVEGLVLSFVYAVVGKGTKNMQNIKKGDTFRAILPLGNGFRLEDKHRKVVLLGGGVGCAPLAMVAASYPDKQYFSYLGFASSDKVILESEFSACSDTKICTDDGSYGTRGYPTALFEREIFKIRPDVILTCGSEAMLKEVARISLKYKVPAYMTGEDRMGCGVGACLVCACKIKGQDGEVHNQRACVEGPVFDLSEIVF